MQNEHHSTDFNPTMPPPEAKQETRSAWQEIWNMVQVELFRKYGGGNEQWFAIYAPIFAQVAKKHAEKFVSIFSRFSKGKDEQKSQALEEAFALMETERKENEQ